MSEPESLATDEKLDIHLRRHAYDRLLMLSDGIFAIAITLAAIEIKPPEHFNGFENVIEEIAAYLDPAFAMPRLHLGLLARRA